MKWGKVEKAGWKNRQKDGRKEMYGGLRVVHSAEHSMCSPGGERGVLNPENSREVNR